MKQLKKKAECPVCYGTGLIGTTDWLTKHMTAEQLDKEKIEAVKEYERELVIQALIDIRERIKTELVATYGELPHINCYLKNIDKVFDNFLEEMK